LRLDIERQNALCTLMPVKVPFRPACAPTGRYSWWAKAYELRPSARHGFDPEGRRAGWSPSSQR